MQKVQQFRFFFFFIRQSFPEDNSLWPWSWRQKPKMFKLYFVSDWYTSMSSLVFYFLFFKSAGQKHYTFIHWLKLYDLVLANSCAVFSVCNDTPVYQIWYKRSQEYKVPRKKKSSLKIQTLWPCPWYFMPRQPVQLYQGNNGKPIFLHDASPSDIYTNLTSLGAYTKFRIKVFSS